MTANQSSSKAWAALLLGIFGLALPLLSPAAVVFGRKALKEIDRSQEQMGGRAGATLGMVLGYVGSAWLAFCLLIGGIYLFGYLTAQYLFTLSAVEGPRPFGVPSLRPLRSLR